MNPEPSAAWIEADWPAPAAVRAGTTIRHGGISRPPFDTFNLAAHVGDADSAVLHNRRALRSRLGLSTEPAWLTQVHGGRVIDLDSGPASAEADGCHTDQAGRACAILTADCVPLLLTDCRGTEIAAVHIGWRGVCRNIVANAVTRFRRGPDQLLAWLGPHITAEKYVVRDEVRDACLRAVPDGAEAFTSAGPSSWHADLAQLVRRQLRSRGITAIYGGGRCTFCDAALFFSHRREGQTGRMASLIWIDPCGSPGQ